MALKNFLVVKAAGVYANGAHYPRGSIVPLEESDVSDSDTHVTALPSDYTDPPAVQMAAVAPTGPNPTAPQQVPPDAVQTIRGHEIPGARLVGEVTAPAEERIDGAGLLDDEDESQGELVEALEEATPASQRDPLDHDENGKKGGSKPGADSTASKGAAAKGKADS